MTIGFVGVISAYIIIAVLLLSMNIAPRWAWWVKATAIVVTSAFFVVTYYSMIDMMGWPVTERLPPKFQLHWAKVVEPDKLLNQPGAVYMWVEELDANNIPFGIPRAYKLPYTAPLDNGLKDAMDMIAGGQDVGGTAEQFDEQEQRAQQQQNQDAAHEAGQVAHDDTGYTDPNELRVNDQILRFGQLEEVKLPDKDTAAP